MDKLNKLTLPATILIASVTIAILFIGYYFVLKPKTEFEACYDQCNTLSSDQKVCLYLCVQNK